MKPDELETVAPNKKSQVVTCASDTVTGTLSRHQTKGNHEVNH